MEAGGEDIAKDDWVEYSITPKDIKNAMTVPDTPLGGKKIPAEKIDDGMIDYQSVNEMDNHYADMFQEYVDSFSPSGNMFGTVERAQLKLQKEQLRKLEKIQNDIDVRALRKNKWRNGKTSSAEDSECTDTAKEAK